MSKKIDISKSLLEDLYIKQKKRIPEISNILGVGRTTVHRKLRLYNIQIRRRISDLWDGYCLECGKETYTNSICKSCSNKKYRENNKDTYLQKMKQYRDKPENKDRFKEYFKKYSLDNIEKIRDIKRKYKEKNKSNMAFIVKKRLRQRLRVAFNNFSKYKKKTKPSIEYGIDFNKIIEYLGPCPGDREDYHIDHIIPLSAFDFNDPEQVKLAFLPENHQWLNKDKNLKKGCRYNKKDFIHYINTRNNGGIS